MNVNEINQRISDLTMKLDEVENIEDIAPIALELAFLSGAIAGRLYAATKALRDITRTTMSYLAMDDDDDKEES